MTAAGRALALETQGLSKRFGHQLAVNSIDLAVPRGSVFGFLGPNGSGKTTTIRMMLGLAAPTAGEVRVLGMDMPRQLDEVLPRVGALVEGPAFYPFLSGAANLHRFDAADRHAAPSTRRARVDEALERVGLSHAARKKVRAYSLGMKQRLGIANALLARRELLVLDEPTNGLDPQGTREVRNLVRSLAADGATVFVSSHLLAEVEQICTHAAIMSAGRLVAQGPLAELRESGTAQLRLVTPDAGTASSVLVRFGLSPIVGHPDGVDAVITSSLPIGAGSDRTAKLSGGAGFDGTAGLPAANGGVAPETIVAALVADGVRVRGFTVERGSLEDRFVALTGEGFDVAQ
ncbi:ABC transporter ATP-binding protein [Arthrobacter globiformis]|uniref:ABC transporter ATP-binding protein n=1 Tax=Arthrobacter globiformis TaxID=1665 RepID=UPI00278D1ED7|nr:ABC transporter ATP-binding protein [Arthrobacter globiformis]MDQ0616640.1 ABC-2 type transport system ATP-binding protein [Arthrobacter globiformis]